MAWECGLAQFILPTNYFVPDFISLPVKYYNPHFRSIFSTTSALEILLLTYIAILEMLNLPKLEIYMNDDELMQSYESLSP